ncbi:hypothetical protein [uncultured Microbacterium sp.]|uniref:hypothetical protein n=1 Tax=uncultured Microbacterium sp. TaxID=191216 RepID=UPI0026073D01|nr:hypothetical protein [uncultured Microbacterium sp.]
MAAPMVTACIWAVRGVREEIDYRSWKKRGCPEGELPSAFSQPRDRDLLIGLPWAVIMILGMIASLSAFVFGVVRLLLGL